MKLFTTLAVEISSACNRRCKFCPVSTFKRSDELMKPRIFEAVLSDLVSLRYAGRVELYIYNEPLRHREHLARCARKLRLAVGRATLMVSTNGDYLKTADDLAWLYEIGIQQVVLNAYTAKRYPLFLQWKQELEHRQGCEFSSNVYGKLSKSQRALKVYDKSSVEAFGSGVFALQNRAGLVPDFLPATAEPLKRMCTKPFRMLNINWEGQAIICCNDYHGDVVAGRVPEQSLDQIWFGPVFNAYRAKLRNKDRSLPLCRVCDCHSGAYPANIGDAAPDEQRATDEQIEAGYKSRLVKRNAIPSSSPVV